MPQLSRRYAVSPKTGWKWVKRFEEGGVSALNDRSRAPHKQAGTISARVVKKIVALRQRYPHWGPVTIRDKLCRESPHANWPAASTIGAILKREGLITPRGRRRKTPAYTQPLAHAKAPNDVWSIDFKGWFRTRDGLRCDPLTVTDAHSRYLLVCRAVSRTNGFEVKRWLEQAFAEHGLPRAIRSDNGAPFATSGLGGLSRLSVWLLRLGITHERIEPGHPEQNGRHERFHKTLNQACCDPPAGNRRAQQRAFNRFRHEYNYERPHRALGGLYPVDVYRNSPLALPEKLPEMRYPQDVAVRRVRSSGEIRWRGELVFISAALQGQTVALKRECSRYWTICYGALILGTLDDAIPAVLK